MKILLDSCISSKTRDNLRSHGFEVDWVGDWKKDPGDSVILHYAHENNQVLITLDKDFGELAIVKEIPHSGIIRLVNLSVKLQTQASQQVIEKYSDELFHGAIITVESTRVRVRPGTR